MSLKTSQIQGANFEVAKLNINCTVFPLSR